MAVTPCGGDLFGADWLLTATNDSDRQERVVYYKQGQPPRCYTQSLLSPARRHCQIFHVLYRRVVRRLHRATDCGSGRSEKVRDDDPKWTALDECSRIPTGRVCGSCKKSWSHARSTSCTAGGGSTGPCSRPSSVLSTLLLPPGCCRRWACPRVWQLLRSERSTKYRSPRSCGRITSPASSGQCPVSWSVPPRPSNPRAGRHRCVSGDQHGGERQKPWCRIAHSMFSRRPPYSLPGPAVELDDALRGRHWSGKKEQPCRLAKLGPQLPAHLAARRRTSTANRDGKPFGGRVSATSRSHPTRQTQCMATT